MILALHRVIFPLTNVCNFHHHAQLNHTSCMRRTPRTMHPNIKYPYLYSILSARERRARAITFVHFTQGYARASALYINYVRLESPQVYHPYFHITRERRKVRAVLWCDAKIRIRNVFSGKTALTHSQPGNKLAFDANHEREKMYGRVNVTQILKTNFWPGFERIAPRVANFLLPFSGMKTCF